MSNVYNSRVYSDSHTLGTPGSTVPHLNLAPSSLVGKLIGVAELLAELETFCNCATSRETTCDDGYRREGRSVFGRVHVVRLALIIIIHTIFSHCTDLQTLF